MKKNLLFLTVAAILSVATIVQSEAQIVTGGLRLGFNASKVVGDFGANYNFVPGIHVGPYVRVAPREKYRIEADVLFSTKGASSDPTGSDRQYAIPFYLDIPVLFNYKPIAGLYFEAGVQPSFALTQMNFSQNSSNTTFDKTGLKTVDFAPVVGLGYEFKKASLGLRGAFGVTNINDFSGYNPNQKNMTLMATFGFKIF
ncbi:MAG TPA: porin family protein [Cytophagaceae bacterium]|jgi:hypothetical protein|nr:porin family protein [Cytophagaceae bacterium]